MRIVIIGGGIAADYIANKFLAQDPSLDILILSKEPYEPYDRIHLCALVDGSATVKDITLELHPQVKLQLNQEVISVDRKAKQVITADNKRYEYDYLIIASGSEPKTLFDISHYDNAITFRSADDSFKIAENLQDRHIVIVGAGPIGLELLDTLVKMPQPKKITLLVWDHALYAPDVDASIIAMMQQTYEADPRVQVSFHDQIIDKTIVNNHITLLKTNKLDIENPFIVFGIGIQPNVNFVRDVLSCNRGILVDRFMRSDDLFIYAVGEAAEIKDNGFCAGHAKDCQEQADVAISHILKTEKDKAYQREVSIDGLKVGAFDFVDVTSPDYNPRDPANEVVLLRANNPQRIDQYILNNNKLMRFFGANSNVDALYLKQLMVSNEDVDPAYFYNSRLENPRGRLVCSCTGAYQQDLVELIADNAVTCLDELKPFSEAGRVCGRCKKDLTALIEATPVDPAEIAARKAAKQQAELEAKKAKVMKRLTKFNQFHPDSPLDENEIDQALQAFDKVKDFNGWVSMMTLNLEMPPEFENLVKRGVYELNRMPVIWLELADCSGNSEAFIKTVNPSIDELILKFVSLDYHELLMAASGPHSETRLDEIIEQDAGNYLLIVEGAIPLAMDGKYLRIGPKGETGVDLLKRVAKHAAAVMAVGSCALDGGVVAAAPNPTGAVGVAEALGRNDIINLPGCPVNPINVVGTLLHYLMLGEMPELDKKNRPLWAYAPRVHDNCERRGHYEAGEFVKEWGDEGAKKGWCLFEVGCKGPYADINCSLVKFNQGTSWPVQVGHGCIACGEGKRAFDELANNRKVVSIPVTQL